MTRRGTRWQVSIDLEGPPLKKEGHVEPRKSACSGCAHVKSFTRIRRGGKETNEVNCRLPVCDGGKKRFETCNAIAASGCWPMKSMAAGVLPEQVEEATKGWIEMGVPTEFDSDTGDAIFTNQAHQDRHLRVKGQFNKDSFGTTTKIMKK